MTEIPVHRDAVETTAAPALAPAPEASIADLIRRLADDTTHLVRTEVKLAKSELAMNARSLIRPMLMIMFGMLLLIAALFTLMGAFVGWLTPAVGPGWAALIVAVVVGAIGAGLALTGQKSLSDTSLAPTRTVASIKQDAQALKGHA